MTLPKLPRGVKHGATPTPAQQLGKLGGKARAKKLTPERRKEIAMKAAATRWGKRKQV